MSSRIRFAAAKDVFEAFPDLKQITAPPRDDVTPLDWARDLLNSRRPTDAVAFLAHVLPRRETVWWARQSVAALLGVGLEDEALKAADTWVRAPDEANRNAALAAAEAADQRSPTAWLAFAAAWSGGSMVGPDKPPMAAPASACARAACAAITMAAAQGEPLGLVGRIRACIEAGIRFAEGGEAKIALPQAQAAKPVAMSGRPK